jgi:hypothetical protein
MRAKLGDPDRACASGITALDEAEPHAIGNGNVRKARSMFPRPWDRLAVVRELDERLQLAA